MMLFSASSSASPRLRVKGASLSRQRDGEGAAAAWGAGAFDSAVVRFGDALDDREAQAEAARGTRPGFVGAVEALEHSGYVFGRYADTGIGDPNADATGAGLQRCCDTASGRGVADGVIE